MSQESMATKAEELHSRHLDCISALKDEYPPFRLSAFPPFRRRRAALRRWPPVYSVARWRRLAGGGGGGAQTNGDVLAHS